MCSKGHPFFQCAFGSFYGCPLVYKSGPQIRAVWLDLSYEYQGGRWVAWRSAQRCWTLRGCEGLRSRGPIHRLSLSKPA